MKFFSLVVAVDSKFGIGKAGGLPWHLPSDLKHFKTVTTVHPGPNVVIMGRKTWDSIPEKFRPLPHRLNVVISRQEDLYLPSGVRHANSLEDALKLADNKGEVFVIGGGQIFKEAMNSPLCQKLYVTHLEEDSSCDTFFPDFSRQFSQAKREGPFVENGITFFFCEYYRNKS